LLKRFSLGTMVEITQFTRVLASADDVIF